MSSDTKVRGLRRRICSRVRSGTAQSGGGGEALYADMGHFGRHAIRVDWFALVMPALVLNYLGQGALVLADQAAAANPFFLLFPGWLLIPIVLLTTAATVIASQAVISGAFALV